MLLTKRVELTLNGRNIKRYEDLGYEIPRYKGRNGKLSIKRGTTITVSIEDLSEGSGHIVDVQCDYCGNVVQRKYNEYIVRKNNFDRDSCSECRYEKIKDINSAASLPEDVGYWSQYENIVKEFIEYVDKYKNINNMAKINPSLTYAIQRSNFSKYDLLLDLGYDLEEHVDRRPNGWYDDFDKLATDIIKISNKYGAFPSYHTVLKELKIGNKVFNQYGGYTGIRQKLDGENRYVDKSGYYNSSFYEVIVANFLYEVGLKDKYQREAYPFPKECGLFRCDFYFKTSNNKNYFCEVWGFDDRNERYAKTRRIKEKLYRENNLSLISIEGWQFDKMKYDDIINYLYSKFQSLIDNPLKTINVESIIPSGYLTDRELLDAILSFAVDEYLPTVTFLEENGLRSYYFEIIRRYNSYNNFASSFGFKVQYNTANYWDDDKMFEYIDYMIDKYGKTLKGSEINKSNDEKLKKFYGIVRNSKYSGYINTKLNYFLDRVNKGLSVPHEDCDWLYSVVKDYGLPEKGQITEENKQVAFEILRASDKSDMLSSEFADYDVKNIYTGDDEIDVIIDQFIYMKNIYGEFLSHSQYNNLKKSDKRLAGISISDRLSRMKIPKRGMEKMAMKYIG